MAQEGLNTKLHCFIVQIADVPEEIELMFANFRYGYKRVIRTPSPVADS